MNLKTPKLIIHKDGCIVFFFIGWRTSIEYGHWHIIQWKWHLWWLAQLLVVKINKRLCHKWLCPKIIFYMKSYMKMHKKLCPIIMFYMKFHKKMQCKYFLIYYELKWNGLKFVDFMKEGQTFLLTSVGNFLEKKSCTMDNAKLSA